MADEPREVYCEQLPELTKVAEGLGLCPEDNGEVLVISAFQLACPDLASQSVLSNVGVRKMHLINETYAMVETSVQLVPTKAELNVAKRNG